MADVTGSIGNEPVELNNAATEATLKLLLQATLSANRQTLSSISNIAQNSGINPQTVAEVNTNLSRLAAGSTNLGVAYGALSAVSESLKIGLSKVADVTKEITAGTGNVSGVFDVFSKLPGVLGMVFSGMQKLAAYQESLLQSYQTITSAGVNFGGSLTDMRQAAANTFMTLDQFTNLVKTNGDALARMGGNVDQGARAFVKLSNTLLSSELGTSLRALGYTTEQVNQGFLSYIETTGGRNRQEMKNTADLTKGAQEYLVQLDGLAQLTGKSRQEQENALKVANQNAAIQAKLATMDEAQKKAYLRGLAEMQAKHGKAGVEMYQAQVLGVPPMTEASQRLTALAPEIAAASKGMADVALRGGSAAETYRYSAQATQGAIQAADRFKNVAGAMSFQGGATAEAMMAITKAATLARQQGRETEAEELEAREKILEEQNRRKESEAAQAVKTQEAMQKLGQELLTKLLPIVSSLWNVMNPLVTTVTKVLTAMLKIPYLFEALGVALLGAIAVYTLAKTRAAVAAVGGMFGGGGRGTLGSAGNPMHIVGGGILGAGRGPGVGGAASGAAGAAGRAAGAAGGALGGLGAGIGSGVGAALTGLSTGLMSLANPRAMLGTVTLGLLSGSLLISAKAFKEFTGVSWKDVGIATLAITGLAAGAAALSFIAPAILIGSAALGALGGAIWLLAKGLREFPTDVFPSLNLSFGTLGDIVSDVFGTINSVVSGMWNAIKATFGLVWDAISWPFKQLGGLVSGAFDVVTGLVSGVYNGIKTTFGLVWDVMSWPFNQIGSVVSGAFDTVTGIISGVYNGIKSGFGLVWEVLSQPFTQIGSLVSSVFGNITNVIKGVGEFISNTFKLVIDKVVNFLGLIKGAITAVAGLFGLGESTPKNQVATTGDLSSVSVVLAQAAKTLQSAGDKLLAFGLSLPSAKGSVPVPASAAISSSPPIFQPASAFVPTSAPVPAPVTNRSTMEFANRYSEKQMQLPPLTEQARREVIEPSSPFGRAAATTIETLNTQLIALNKLSEEMLKSVKESAEYARRNVDATRSLNPNLLKR